MFVPVVLMALWVFAMAVSSVDISQLAISSLVPGAEGTLGGLLVDCMWVVDLLLLLSYAAFAGREILKTFFKNPKNAWRPCVAAVVFLPWLIPLCDLFRQMTLVSPQAEWYRAFFEYRPALPLAGEFYLLFLIINTAISAFLWNSWGRAGNSKWYLTREDVRYNRRIDKARGVRKRQLKKIKKQEERDYERQVLREVFLKNKEAAPKADKDKESIQAQETAACQPLRLDTEALDTALAAEAEKEVPDYEKYLRLPPEATQQQLNIRFAIQITIMVLLWFVAMWLCDQVMGAVSPGSDMPLVLGFIDITPFSNFAAVVYGTCGLPLMQDVPLGAEWILESPMLLQDSVVNGPLPGLVADVVAQIA